MKKDKKSTSTLLLDKKHPYSIPTSLLKKSVAPTYSGVGNLKFLASIGKGKQPRKEPFPAYLLDKKSSTTTTSTVLLPPSSSIPTTSQHEPSFSTSSGKEGERGESVGNLKFLASIGKGKQPKKEPFPAYLLDKKSSTTTTSTVLLPPSSSIPTTSQHEPSFSTSSLLSMKSPSLNPSIKNDPLLPSSPPSPVDCSSPGEPTDISSSPIKEDASIWISRLDLYERDKGVLKSDAWLTDGIIYATQCSLREQTKESIFGWQSTQCSKNNSFKPIPSRLPFIQVLHAAECHWVVASNIDTKGGRCLTTSVGYYDSGRPLTVSVKMRKTICSFLKCEAAFLNFDIVNVMEHLL